LALCGVVTVLAGFGMHPKDGPTVMLASFMEFFFLNKKESFMEFFNCRIVCRRVTASALELSTGE
jgi:hypothetical protein